MNITQAFNQALQKRVAPNKRAGVVKALAPLLKNMNPNNVDQVVFNTAKKMK